MIDIRTTEDAAGAWHPCKNEVGSLVRRLRVRRHVRQMRTAALMALLGVVAFSGHCFYPEIAAQMEVRMSGGYCERYQQEMEHFYCDKAQMDLDPELWAHIARCPDCRGALKFYLGVSHPAAIVRNDLHGKHVDLPTSNVPISAIDVHGHSVLAVGR
jgi:hypothetical protein